MKAVEVHQGDSPVVLGLPHTGTFVPPDIAAHLNDCGGTLADTDWHVDRLYDGLLPGATTVRATFHRYVIDANRDPAGQSLYPGQNTTTLVPLTDFDGVDIWEVPPTDAEIGARTAAWHQPYHAALTAELARVRDLHGVAVLYDCHSIRSRIPFLFEGVLPDLNIGTNSGASCATALAQSVARTCGAATAYSSILNGRFKGGWTTRHYGDPATGIHAIQMEIAQSAYLTEEAPPWRFDVTKAAPLRALLQNILHDIAEMAPSLARTSEV